MQRKIFILTKLANFTEKISKNHKGTTKKKISDLTFEEFQPHLVLQPPVPPSPKNVLREMVFSMAPGAIGGALAKTTISPLVRAKIHFQTHPEHNFQMKKVFKFLKNTYHQDGILSLWRGNSAAMAIVIPKNAVLFASHDKYKKFLGVSNGAKTNNTTPLKHFLAGCLAGATGQTLTYPLDRAQAIMAVTRARVEYRNIFQVFKTIVEREGIKKLYRGFAPTMMGNIPYGGTAFCTYEMLKGHFTKRDKTNGGIIRPNGIQKFVFGGTAGFLGQAAAYPLDTVRRRMQTAKVMGVETQYKNVYGILKKILKEEGVRKGLYKGLSMNLIKGPVGSGICFMTVDYLKEIFKEI